MALFSVIFFPGVLLHEASHYVMAKLLDVPTGRVSLVPHIMPGGKLQMGFVETEQVDWVRETLIGAAPLISGGLFTAYVGLYQLGLIGLVRVYASQGLRLRFCDCSDSFRGSDFWIWLYLAFVVSSTMLPSASDRRAWLPLAAVLRPAGGISLLAGAGPWMARIWPPV